jgi:hypothetical protein
MGRALLDNEDPETWFYTLWFVAGDRADILAQLYRNRKGLWLMVRERLYDPTDPMNEPWSGQDFKKSKTIPIAEAEFHRVDAKVKMLLDLYTAGWDVKVREKVRIDGRGEELLRKIQGRSWANVKSFGSKDEAEAYLKRPKAKVN